MSRLELRAAALSLLLLFLFALTWEVLAAPPSAAKATPSVDSALVAGASGARFPRPSELVSFAVEQLSDPFYDRGSNDKGIGIQLAHSLGRVLLGYGLALVIAIPLGFAIGMSPLLMRALYPFIQVLRPISPLAWMPLALFVIRDSSASAVFVIFVCSLWPALINTAFGVAGVHADYLNVAKTLKLSKLRTALTVILPAAAPTILTGMRISIGVSWLVIVAAEMLVGGTGIGYYVWNEWNNLDLNAVLFSVLMIGVVGMLLDSLLAKASQWVSFES
jgi:nitrate/nitrite transport system permease protein